MAMQDLINQFITQSAFGFDLTDAENKPQIHINSAGPNTLKLVITNKSTSDAITIQKYSAPPTTGEGQLGLQFSIPTLSEKPSKPTATSSPPQLPSSPQQPQGEWVVNNVLDAQQNIQVMYLAWAGASDIVISSSSTLTITISYGEAFQEQPHNADTDVTFGLGDKLLIGTQPVTSGPVGKETMTLVSGGATPSAPPPLSVDFVGRPTLLNDGQTANTLTFALTAMIGGPLPITPKTTTGPAATEFTVWFDAAPNSATSGYAYALAKLQDLDNITFDTMAGWNIPSAPTGHGQGSNPQWLLTSDTVQALDPEAPVLFQLQGIKSDLPPGICRMYLRYDNLPGFPPGVLIARIEKSPLAYGAGAGQGVYLAGGQPTSAPVVSYDSGLTIIQNDTSNPSASFLGGTGVQADVVTVARFLNAGGLVTPLADVGILSVTAIDPHTNASLTVNGKITVNGKSTFNGEVVAGTLSVAATGPISDASLTVDGTSTFNGQVVAGSTVAFMKPWVRIDLGTEYTADTDGFAIGGVGLSGVLRGVTIYGLMNGNEIEMKFTAGTVLITMPIPKQSTFKFVMEPTDPRISFYWVPFGSSVIATAADGQATPQFAPPTGPGAAAAFGSGRTFFQRLRLAFGLLFGARTKP